MSRILYIIRDIRERKETFLVAISKEHALKLQFFVGNVLAFEIPHIDHQHDMLACLSTVVNNNIDSLYDP